MHKIFDVLRYPLNGKIPTLRFLLGCAINCVPFFGNAVTTGYAIKGMREVMIGKEGMPQWTDFMGLFLSGIRFFAASFIFSLVFLIPFSIGLFLFVIVKSAWAVILGFFVVMIGGILALSSSFIFPMATIYMLKCDEKIKAIFSFSEIMLNIKKAAIPYTLNVLIVWFAALLFLYFSFSLMSLKVGFLLVIILLYYFVLIVTYVFGKLGESLGDIVIDRINLVEEDLNK